MKAPRTYVCPVTRRQFHAVPVQEQEIAGRVFVVVLCRCCDHKGTAAGQPGYEGRHPQPHYFNLSEDIPDTDSVDQQHFTRRSLRWMEAV